MMSFNNQRINEQMVILGILFKKCIWLKVVAKEFFRDDSKNVGKWVIERLPSNVDPAVWVPTLKAIASAYHDVYGVWPENYGKYPLH